MRVFPSSGRKARAIAAGLAVALAATTTTPLAFADAESDAKDLFDRGHRLRKSGDCGNAVPLFQKAWKIYPRALGIARNIAECEEQLGHFASARRAWLDVKRGMITGPANPSYEGWDVEAEEAARRLLPKVATLHVDVTVKSTHGEGPATEADGVELLVNGENLGPNLVGTPLERDPGTYRIRVQAPQSDAVSSEVTLAAGETKHVALHLVKREPISIVTEPPPVGADPGAGKRTVGWVLVGVGGATLITGIVTAILQSAAKSDLDDRCPTYQNCDPSLRDTVDRGELTSVLTNVLLPVGAVTAAAGVGLVLWGNAQTKDAARASSSLRVTPGPGRVDAVWRF